MVTCRSKLSKHLRFLAQLLMLWALGMWVIWADPFGLSSASERALAEDISRSRAYVQPVPPAPITVVNIDYDSIRALHESGRLEANDWPLTYRDHARILSRLVSRQNADDVPAAVFYDIFFERPRTASGDMRRLGSVLGRIAQGTDQSSRPYPPVYLAGGGGKIPISDETYALLNQPKLVASVWDGLGDNYPLSRGLRDADRETAVPQSAPSAAWALYQELCRARGHGCGGIQAQDVLSTQWVLREDRECGNWTTRVPRYVLLTIFRYLGFGGAPASASTDCLPVHQVRLSELFLPDGGRLRPPYLGSGEPFVVLAGVIMPSLNDYHATPLYERLAGVYIHAMALENLDRLGGDYLRTREIRHVSSLVWLLLTTLVCIWRQYFRQKAGRLIRARCGCSVQPQPSNQGLAGAAARQALGRLARRAAWLSLWVLMVFAIYVLCYSILDIALQGWLFMIGLVSLLLFWDGASTAARNP
ncbi:CHASE2 domain-containing protein [Castellaniella sp.]|uniref:CHASE2 domain-containing protein n=1 Tax=Castellaniella sp. TaxID=1955812 RepID=UPI003C771BE6